MKRLVIALLIVCTSALATAQDVLFTYDMNLLPDEQGFVTSLGSECPDVWSVSDGILQYRGCDVGSSSGFSKHSGMFTGVSTAQLDARMRVLDSDGYAFEFILVRGSVGRYFKFPGDLFPDTEYHDVVIFADFDNNTWETFIDEEPVDTYNFSFSYHDGFTWGDGNSSGTWGNVDFESVVITGNVSEPVSNEEMTWSTVKGLYR